MDVRHLSLIADFMTQAGGYRACNRIGIESSTSPLLKMSFETAAKFLTEVGGCVVGSLVVQLVQLRLWCGEFPIVCKRRSLCVSAAQTQAGGYRACNRIGIESSTSPLLKMSFETAAKFLPEVGGWVGGCVGASFVVQLVQLRLWCVLSSSSIELCVWCERLQGVQPEWH